MKTKLISYSLGVALVTGSVFQQNLVRPTGSNPYAKGALLGGD